jgi:hypothetical protein
MICWLGASVHSPVPKRPREYQLEFTAVFFMEIGGADLDKWFNSPEREYFERIAMLGSLY